MAKFREKYRIESARLQDWDYANDAAYFITICAFERECYFGEIVNNRMVLSHIGVIADVLWYEIKNHAKNIELESFVVMPNHIHGIIKLIGNEDYATDRNMHPVETRHALSLQPHQFDQKNSE